MIPAERESLDSYDAIIVATSGGKDSAACLVHLLEAGAPFKKIELWHHDIDGVEGGGKQFMDWPCTPGYCRALGRDLELPLRIQFRKGGFIQELMRYHQPTGEVVFDKADGTVGRVGGHGKNGTRRLFPQVSSDLSVRWCSAYLKIDVAAAALRNDERFQNGAKVLLVTGERAEESASRARYQVCEVHKATSKKRLVHQWRPVHGWTEKEVWAALERYRIRPHPAYRLGFGRVSCMSCIFGNDDQWATIRRINEDSFNRIAAVELMTRKTIHRKLNVVARADKGVPFLDLSDPEIAKLVALSQSHDYDEDVILGLNETWEMPAGAFKETGGPT
jgi:3'-phosphoadenosine 5'-phosphosulfate sulfotransferase (PAPS reductase)/FAD synthetase